MRRTRARACGRSVRAALTAVLLCGAASFAQPAHADETDVCLSSHAQTQRFRHDGKLLAARQELLACARELCPRPVRAECAQWLTEVDALIPSVVVSARSATGADVTDVRVLIDGEVVMERLDGKEVALDPGPHTFRYEHAGEPPIDENVVAIEGERARHLLVKIRPRPANEPSADRPGTSSPAERPIPVAAYVLGGISALSVASFTTFGLLAYAKEQSLRDQGCSPNCSKSDTDAVKTKYLIGDISLGVGLLAFAGAAYLVFTRPTQPAAAHAEIRFDLRASASGASVGASGAF